VLESTGYNDGICATRTLLTLRVIFMSTPPFDSFQLVWTDPPAPCMLLMLWRPQVRQKLQ